MSGERGERVCSEKPSPYQSIAYLVPITLDVTVVSESRVSSFWLVTVACDRVEDLLVIGGCSSLYTTRQILAMSAYPPQVRPIGKPTKVAEEAYPIHGDCDSSISGQLVTL